MTDDEREPLGEVSSVIANCPAGHGGSLAFSTACGAVTLLVSVEEITDARLTVVAERHTHDDGWRPLWSAKFDRPGDEQATLCRWAPCADDLTDVGRLRWSVCGNGPARFFVSATPNHDAMLHELDLSLESGM